MTSQRIDFQFEFPFDLNNLFNLTYSFDVLKQAIEFLAKNQAENQKVIYNMQNNNAQTNISVDSNSNEQLSKLQQLYESLQKQVNEQGQKIKDNENSIILLKSMSGGGGKGDDEQNKNIFDALEILIENLRKECYATFAKKDELQDFNQRIQDLEEQNKNFNQELQNQNTIITQCKQLGDQNKLDIDNLNNIINELQNKKYDKEFEDLIKRLNDMEKKLDNKLDIDIFNNEVAALRNLIGEMDQEDNKIEIKKQQVQKQQTNQFSSKDVNQLKELLTKFPHFEEMLQKLLNDMKQMNLQQMKDQIEQLFSMVQNCQQKDEQQDKEITDLKQRMEQCELDIQQLKQLLQNSQPSQSNISQNDINLLKKRVEVLENTLTTLKKSFTDFKKQIEERLMDLQKQGNKGGQEIDIGEISHLGDDLKKLRQELNKFKEDTNNNMKYLLDSLNLKADKQELLELEARIMDKLNEIVKNLLGQFADKNETKKRLNALEKNVKNIMDMLMKNDGSQERHNEDDAMFAKKPLGGWSCASCERNLVNLQGQMADYLAWKKLPFREANERIARYGQGFSRILQMIRPESIDGSQQQNARNEKQRMKNSLIMEENIIQNNQNNTTLQDHSIFVEMPQNKPSARTGYNFYKNGSIQNSAQKNQQIRGGGFNYNQEESPQKTLQQNLVQDQLPNLSIKQEKRKQQ